MPILQMRILEQHSWHGVSLGQGSRSQDFSFCILITTSL